MLHAAVTISKIGLQLVETSRFESSAKNIEFPQKLNFENLSEFYIMLNTMSSLSPLPVSSLSPLPVTKFSGEPTKHDNVRVRVWRLTNSVVTS